jgi:hypothetical protein
MRSVTGQDYAVLNAPDGYSVFARVWVWDGAAFQDVTTLENRDWLVSVSWDESMTEPCAQAKVQLRRRLEDLSLNPLVSNKLTGVLALGRTFIIEAATCPLGDPPQVDEWREVFRGEVETLDLENDPIVITGRDMGGRLLRSFIETEREYGSASGVAVETILQSILTDNGTGVTLYVPTPTGVVFNAFPVKPCPVLTALRNVALKIGWDVRYRWDGTTGTFRLTLFQPPRTSTTSLWTFHHSRVKAVTRLSQTVHDVRNVVRLYYYNRASPDAASVAPLAYVESTDATSIATYGRSYMQLAESEDSPIDSPTEAQRMADAARDDLKAPLLDFGVDLHFHYAVQLGDVVTFEPSEDDNFFTSAQTLAVVSAAHSINAKGHTTSLTLGGKPVGPVDQWFRRESRVNRSAMPPTLAPSPVTGLTATSTAGGAIITFTASAVPPLAVEFELHMSTTSGFSTTSSTFVELASTTSFTRNGLTPGTTYYVKVVARDAVGNRAVSSEVSVVPRYVSPIDLQPVVSYSSRVPNSSFEAWTRGASYPPDAWDEAPAEGLSSAMVWTASAQRITTAYSGAYALRFTSAGGPSDTPRLIRSQYMGIGAGQSFVLEARYSIASGINSAVVHIRWYDASFAELVADRLVIVGPTVGTWTRMQTFATSPSTARYARLYVGCNANAGSVDIDSVTFELYVQPQADVEPLSASAPWVADATYPPRGYVDSTGRMWLEGRVTSGGTGQVAVTTSEYPQRLQYLDVLTNNGRGIALYRTDGAIYIESLPAGATVVILDGCSARVR